jgi:hypothetical protein
VGKGLAKVNRITNSIWDHVGLLAVHVWLHISQVKNKVWLLVVIGFHLLFIPAIIALCFDPENASGLFSIVLGSMCLGWVILFMAMIFVDDKSIGIRHKD